MNKFVWRNKLYLISSQQKFLKTQSQEIPESLKIHLV